MKKLCSVILAMLFSFFSVLPLAAQEDSVQAVALETEAVAAVAEEVEAVEAEVAVEEDLELGQSLVDFFKSMGYYMLGVQWKCIIMLVVGCILLYLAIVKGFEPLLLLPIAMGMILTNLPGAEMYHSELFAGGHVHWQELAAKGGLLDYLYLGVKLGIYPCLIFVGVGAMTDFGPLLANPKSLLMGAGAQLGIFATYLCTIALGFTSDIQTGAAFVGTDSYCRILVHGFGAGYPASDHEGSDNQKGTRHRNETITRGFKNGKNSFPDSHYHNRFLDGSGCRISDRLPYVGKPYA